MILYFYLGAMNFGKEKKNELIRVHTNVFTTTAFLVDSLFICYIVFMKMGGTNKENVFISVLIICNNNNFLFMLLIWNTRHGVYTIFTLQYGPVDLVNWLVANIIVCLDIFLFCIHNGGDKHTFLIEIGHSVVWGNWLIFTTCF